MRRRTLSFVHSTDDFKQAASHVGYEMVMMAATERRCRDVRPDAVEANAYLEAALIHSRTLIEFLLAKRNGVRRDDISPGDFVDGWSAGTALGSETLDILRGAQALVRKHLAHLTWTRLDERVAWPHDMVVGNVLGAMARFVVHLEERGATTAPTFRGNDQAMAYFVSG